jgi:hypothetical protein
MQTAIRLFPGGQDQHHTPRFGEGQASHERSESIRGTFAGLNQQAALLESMRPQGRTQPSTNPVGEGTHVALQFPGDRQRASDGQAQLSARAQAGVFRRCPLDRDMVGRQVAFAFLLLGTLSETPSEGQSTFGERSCRRPRGRLSCLYPQSRPLDHQADAAEPSGGGSFGGCARLPLRP